jgi:hypothetical protein
MRLDVHSEARAELPQAASFYDEQGADARRIFDLTMEGVT